MLLLVVQQQQQQQRGLLPLLPLLVLQRQHWSVESEESLRQQYSLLLVATE
jgi:hypothetical protein